LCGDLNVAHREIDIFEPKGKNKRAGFTPEERQSFSKFLGSGFVDTYRFLNPAKVAYSYWNMRSGARAKNAGWRLDYFVCSGKMVGGDQPGPKVVDSRINSEFGGSDHCPISLILRESSTVESG
jgi:exodeoxyribonuclease III